MDSFIFTAVGRTGCSRHGVPLLVACYGFFDLNGDYKIGICNHRARKAGFVGRISSESLSSRKGVANGKRR